MSSSLTVMKPTDVRMRCYDGYSDFLFSRHVRIQPAPAIEDSTVVDAEKKTPARISIHAPGQLKAEAALHGVLRV